MGETEHNEPELLSDEALYMRGEITVEEYLARVDKEAREVAAADLDRREREQTLETARGAGVQSLRSTVEMPEGHWDQPGMTGA